MLKRAGFTAFRMQYPIELWRPLGTTYPDFYFDDPHDIKEGICIYLDGMSRHIHGSPATSHKDRQIREELRSRNYEVIEKTLAQLTDVEAMKRHFLRLGRLLCGKEKTTEIAKDTGWYVLRED